MSALTPLLNNISIRLRSALRTQTAYHIMIFLGMIVSGILIAEIAYALLPHSF